MDLYPIHHNHVHSLTEENTYLYLEIFWYILEVHKSKRVLIIILRRYIKRDCKHKVNSLIIFSHK